MAAPANERIDLIGKRAPLGGIENAGRRLVYTDEPTAVWQASEETNKVTDLRYSLGITVSGSGTPTGTIGDVEPDSPAAASGIYPGMRLVAVDGRQWSADLLHAALADAKRTHRPLQLLVTSDDYYKTIDVAAYDGDRYPRLERIAGTPDLLSRIRAPRTLVAR